MEEGDETLSPVPEETNVPWGVVKGMLTIPEGVAVDLLWLNMFQDLSKEGV